MERKDPSWEEYYEDLMRRRDEEEFVPRAQPDLAVEIEEDNEEELSIRDRIDQIRNKYGNND